MLIPTLRGQHFLVPWVALVLCGWTVHPANAQNAVAEPGLYVPVPGVLTSDSVTRIVNKVDFARSRGSQRPSKIIFDFNPDNVDTNSINFGPCYDLADYIVKLRDVSTIAFVQKKVTGHSVLPVLACQEIVMAREARLGEILTGENAQLDNIKVQAYQGDWMSIRAPQLAVIAKMFDREVRLGKGQKNGGDYYVDLRKKAELEKQGVTISDTTPLRFGQPGILALYTTEQAKQVGLCKVSAETRLELAELYNIAPGTLRDDPLNGRPPAAFRYTLTGKIDSGVRESVARMVREVVRQKGNVLFLQLECSGGDLQAARDLAEDLIQFERPDNGGEGILIVAFIPNQAPDTAAIVAMGCSEIVMSLRKNTGDEASEATIGNFEAYVRSQKDNPELLAETLKELALKQGYSPLLAEGMVNADLGIVRVRDKVDRTKRQLMSEQEYEANKADWVSEGVVKQSGQLLTLTATQAEQLGLARATIDTTEMNDLFSKYGVENSTVKDATPAWLDRFASFLRKPTVTVLLVVIGFIGLILELKVPGTTVPGIVSALCFILVFWCHTQFSGQVAVLSGLLFLFGLVLILLEVFVFPGFGAAGITGILLMIGSLGLVTVDKIPNTGDEWIAYGVKLAQFFFALIGGTILAFVIARYLPHLPFANRMYLAPSDESELENSMQTILPGAAKAASLLGAIGTTATVLRPAGTVRFGDEFIDVVTEGGYINSGSRVQVVEVEGNRIVVKEV